MNQLTVIVVKAELNKVYTHCGQNQLLKNMVKALVEMKLIICHPFILRVLTSA